VLTPENIAGGIVVLAVVLLIVIVGFVPANALLPTLLIFGAIVIEVNNEQPLNALAPILVTVVGIVIDGIFAQFRNELAPIVVTAVFDIITDSKLLHPLNAVAPIPIMLLPPLIVRVVNVLTPENIAGGIVVLAVVLLIVIVGFVPANALLLTLVILAGIVIEVKSEQPLNELVPILVTVFWIINVVITVSP
jgi:hypothetical protein